jgi:broad-specificity NMP kinase
MKVFLVMRHEPHYHPEVEMVFLDKTKAENKASELSTRGWNDYSVDEVEVIE